MEQINKIELQGRVGTVRIQTYSGHRVANFSVAVDTDMNGNLDEEEKASLVEEIPAGRFATPEEVAEAIFKLTELPDYTTGSILRMDGGWI